MILRICSVENFPLLQLLIKLLKHLICLRTRSLINTWKNYEKTIHMKLHKAPKAVSGIQKRRMMLATIKEKS